MHGDDARFFLQVTFRSLEEFAIFCAILKGDDVGDDAKLRELTARLKKATTTLSAAERADIPKP